MSDNLEVTAALRRLIEAGNERRSWKNSPLFLYLVAAFDEEAKQYQAELLTVDPTDWRRVARLQTELTGTNQLIRKLNVAIEQADAAYTMATEPETDD
jgi:hypothetical protein